MKKHLSTIALLLVFFLGLCVLLYPTVSDYWNSRVQSHAILDYESVIQELAPEDYSAIFAQADDYNRQLAALEFPLRSHTELEGYASTLDVSGTGIMGYISIPKIKVELPIYHGTSAEVLNVAVGHLEGTSLPVGGEGTHAVLSAHRGLPSAKLFTELDKMVVGDSFTVTILDRVLTYEIDQILIVKPSEVEALAIAPGEDQCTLVTCTPYGVNSHRLLVRGRRVETLTPKAAIFVPNDGYRIDPLIVTPIVAIPMLLFALVVFLIKYRKR